MELKQNPNKVIAGLKPKLGRLLSFILQNYGITVLEEYVELFDEHYSGTGRGIDGTYVVAAFNWGRGSRGSDFWQVIHRQIKRETDIYDNPEFHS